MYPYLRLVYPLYLFILVAVSVFLGWAGKRGHSRISSLRCPSAFLVGVSAVIYVCRVTWVNLMEFNSLYCSNTMLAVNDQLVWYISKTAKSFSPMYGVNYFFGHFKPILYIFALFYKIIPGPPTLLFIQTLLLGTGAIPVYLIARKKIKENFYHFISPLTYLLSMTLISYTSFHTATCAIPFLLWAVYFMEKEYAKMSFFFCILAILCKENVCLIIFALGLYILIFRKDLNIRKPLGYSLLIFSLTWFYTTVYIIMPILSAESRTEFLKEVNAIYSYLNPVKLIRLLPSPDRILYIFFLFLPFGFLPLFSPLSLVALPEVLINLLSSNAAQIRIFNYYSGIILAFFFLASLEVIYKRRWLSLYLLSFVFFTLLFFGPSPEYTVDRHSRIGKNILESIPEDASVYAQVGLASHLSRREKVNIYLVDYNYNKNRKFNLKEYEYVILDLKGDRFPDTTPYGERYFRRLKELIDTEGMRVVEVNDGFILLRRDGLDRVTAWRSIFIEEGLPTVPVLCQGKDIALVEVNSPPLSKQGALFWIELKFVKLGESLGQEKMQIEFRGKRQKFAITPRIAHGIFDTSYWRKGEVLNHIEVIRFSPFLWPGNYEIFFSLGNRPVKIGEVLVKNRNLI